MSVDKAPMKLWHGEVRGWHGGQYKSIYWTHIEAEDWKSINAKINMLARMEGFTHYDVVNLWEVHPNHRRNTHAPDDQ